MDLAYSRVKGAPAVERLCVMAFHSGSLWMWIKGLRSVARAKLGHIVPAGALLEIFLVVVVCLSRQPRQSVYTQAPAPLSGSCLFFPAELQLLQLPLRHLVVKILDSGTCRNFVNFFC